MNVKPCVKIARGESTLLVVRQRNIPAVYVFRSSQEDAIEWLQYIMRSEKDHFVPSVRKEIANSIAARDLYISFKRRLQGPWILHSGKQTIYPPVVRLFSEYYFLNPFLSAMARSRGQNGLAFRR